MIYTPTELMAMAYQATQALLEQRSIVITQPPGTDRDGFPLPAKRVPNQPDGSSVQEYRPLAILEYVNDSIKTPRKPGQQAAEVEA